MYIESKEYKQVPNYMIVCYSSHVYPLWYRKHEIYTKSICYIHTKIIMNILPCLTVGNVFS